MSFFSIAGTITTVVSFVAFIAIVAWAWSAKRRKAFDEAGKIRISLKKGGGVGSPEQDPYVVDALSGATITSNGVTRMLHFWLGENGFGPYLAKARARGGL